MLTDDPQREESAAENRLPRSTLPITVNAELNLAANEIDTGRVAIMDEPESDKPDDATQPPRTVIAQPRLVDCLTLALPWMYPDPTTDTTDPHFVAFIASKGPPKVPEDPTDS